MSARLVGAHADSPSEYLIDFKICARQYFFLYLRSELDYIVHLLLVQPHKNMKCKITIFIRNFTSCTTKLRSCTIFIRRDSILMYCAASMTYVHPPLPCGLLLHMTECYIVYELFLSCSWASSVDMTSKMEKHKSYAKKFKLTLFPRNSSNKSLTKTTDIWYKKKTQKEK